MSARPRAYAWTVVAYLTALAVAVGVGRLLREQHPLAMLAAADVAGTLVVFGFSRALNNASLYDPYWSLAPIAIATYWLVVGDGLPARQWLVFALVCAWGLRLTYNFLSGWPGLHHEDWRYRDLREKHGRAFWWVSLFGIHLFPTALVFGGCLALWPAFTSDTPLDASDWVALAITSAAIAIEALADRQLRAFVQSNPPKGAIMRRGLWSWSRHPNYFGEILFWWGLWTFGQGAAPNEWMAVGPLAITMLFALVSIPMIEKRMRARRDGWDAYCERVSVLVPKPPRPVE